MVIKLDMEKAFDSFETIFCFLSWKKWDSLGSSLNGLRIVLEIHGLNLWLMVALVIYFQPQGVWGKDALSPLYQSISCIMSQQKFGAFQGWGMINGPKYSKEHQRSQSLLVFRQYASPGECLKANCNKFQTSHGSIFGSLWEPCKKEVNYLVGIVLP